MCGGCETGGGGGGGVEVLPNDSEDDIFFFQASVHASTHPSPSFPTAKSVNNVKKQKFKGQGKRRYFVCYIIK